MEVDWSVVDWYVVDWSVLNCAGHMPGAEHQMAHIASATTERSDNAFEKVIGKLIRHPNSYPPQYTRPRRRTYPKPEDNRG